jgi:hypothetical protein
MSGYEKTAPELRFVWRGLKNCLVVERFVGGTGLVANVVYTAVASRIIHFNLQYIFFVVRIRRTPAAISVHHHQGLMPNFPRSFRVLRQ